MASRQKTIKNEVKVKGIGLFSGESTEIRLCPLPVDSGIIFKRIDLDNELVFPALLENVVKSQRCTAIGNEKGSILTVEHLLSAIHAFGIDNILVEVNGPEIPVGDGSSNLFVSLFEKANVVELDKKKDFYKLEKPVYFSNDEIHLVAIPDDSFRISYTLHYPHSDFIKSQYMTIEVNKENYTNSIAPCRTFSIYEEIEPLIEKKMIKGGGLDNALIIKNNKILNPEGSRFFDEMVRHKILDLIGDLSLIGRPLKAHVIAIKSGHMSNISFAKKIKKIMETS